jgi:hypothetical protein
MLNVALNVVHRRDFSFLKYIGMPLAVPFETTNEKTSNSSVKSDFLEQFMVDAVTKDQEAC